MLRKLMIGLASAAALSAYTLTPTLADVNYCMDHPNAETCPYGSGAVDESPQQMKNMKTQAHLFHGRYTQGRHEAAAQKA
jgi:hypothetical protein